MLCYAAELCCITVAVPRIYCIAGGQMRRNQFETNRLSGDTVQQRDMRRNKKWHSFTTNTKHTHLLLCMWRWFIDYIRNHWTWFFCVWFSSFIRICVYRRKSETPSTHYNILSCRLPAWHPHWRRRWWRQQWRRLSSRSRNATIKYYAPPIQTTSNPQ